MHIEPFFEPTTRTLSDERTVAPSASVQEERAAMGSPPERRSPGDRRSPT
jgi:hypothetical protein